jgi:hypothetical protein
MVAALNFFSCVCSMLFWLFPVLLQANQKALKKNKNTSIKDNFFKGFRICWLTPFLTIKSKEKD